jgi:hypothetical protein
LSERWLIELVVTIFSITDKIDDDIVVELLAILSSGGENVMDVFKRLCVNVEDRSIDGLS